MPVPTIVNKSHTLWKIYCLLEKEHLHFIRMCSKITSELAHVLKPYSDVFENLTPPVSLPSLGNCFHHNQGLRKRFRCTGPFFNNSEPVPKLLSP